MLFDETYMFQFNCTFTWHVIYHCYALRFPCFSRTFRTNSILSPWRYLDQETCRGWLYVLLLFFVCRKPTLLVTHRFHMSKVIFLRWSIQIIVFSFWFVYNFMVSLENTWFIQGRASKFRHALGSNDKNLYQTTPAVTMSFSVSHERLPH